MVNSVSLQNTTRATPIYVGSQIIDEEPVSVMAFGTAKDLGVMEDDTKVHFYTGYTETKNARIVDARAADIDGSHRTLWARGQSSLKVAFDLSPQDLEKDLGLYLTHLSSDPHREPYDSAIKIFVNGYQFTGKYVPKSHDWIANDQMKGDNASFSSLLVHGRNTVEIQLHPSASSHYWIHSLMVK